MDTYFLLGSLLAVSVIMNIVIGYIRYCDDSTVKKIVKNFEEYKQTVKKIVKNFEKYKQTSDKLKESYEDSCKSYEDIIAEDDRHIDALKKIISDLKHSTMDLVHYHSWKDVNTELPEKFEDVYLISDGDYAFLAKWVNLYDDVWGWQAIKEYGINAGAFKVATHWMPITLPPKSIS